MTPGALFNRAYSLTIANAPKSTDSQVYGNMTPDMPPLRVTFEIGKNVKSTPNHAKIEVYNLAPASRSRFAIGALVTLTAGYVGNAALIFYGMITKIESKKTGADIVTSIECADGGGAINSTAYVQTYRNTTLATILSDVARAMSQPSAASPVGIDAGVVIGIPNVPYKKLSVHGSCSVTMNKLTRNHGLEWNVQNNRLNIAPRTHAYGISQAQVISPTTGLIGIPSKNSDAVTFTALLNPALAAGSAVVMQSVSEPALNGTYKIRSVVHKGDTHESTWQVECTCARLASAVALPAASGFNYAAAVI